MAMLRSFSDFQNLEINLVSVQFFQSQTSSVTYTLYYRKVGIYPVFLALYDLEIDESAIAANIVGLITYTV